MPHHSNHRVVHRDVNVTISVVIVEIQVEADVVIGGRWTRERRCARVVGAACVSHHTGQLNDVTDGRCLAVYGVSRETNKICKIYMYNSVRNVWASDPGQHYVVCVAQNRYMRFYARVRPFHRLC